MPIRITNLAGGLNTRSTQFQAGTGTDNPLDYGLLENMELNNMGPSSRPGLESGPTTGTGKDIFAEETLHATDYESFSIVAGLNIIALKRTSLSSVSSYLPRYMILKAYIDVTHYGVIAYLGTDIGGYPGSPICYSKEILSLAPKTTGQYPAAGTHVVIFDKYTATISNNTAYWVFLSFYAKEAGKLYIAKSSVSGEVVLNGVSQGSKACGFRAFKGTSAVTTIQGLHDYRSGSPVTQTIMKAQNGAISWTDGTSAWASLKTGLSAASSQIYDFETASDYEFICDGGTNTPQVWDQSSSATMNLGYRMSPYYAKDGATLTSPSGNTRNISSLSGRVATFAATTNWAFIGDRHGLWNSASSSYPTEFYTVTSVDTATNTVVYDRDITTGLDRCMQGGQTTASLAGATFTAGEHRLLAVTKLRSGGYRASAETVFISAGGDSLRVTNIAMNSDLVAGSQFGFDNDALATTWFIAAMGSTAAAAYGVTAGVYYKIPPLSIRYPAGGAGSANPMPNSTTSFDIVNLTGLSSQNTLVQEYTLQQEYFTLQTDAPKFKYLKQFRGFLMGAGDTETPNRLWASQFQAPMIWSRFGQNLGSYYEPDTKGDGDIITGIFPWQGKFYVMRTRTIQMATFSSNAVLPFNFDNVATQFGCVSHWSCQDISKGFVFMSPQGPAICYGSFTSILPASEKILNLFEPTGIQLNGIDQYYPQYPFNMDTLNRCTSGHNVSKRQVWWSMSRVNENYRNEILVYDYTNEAFSIFKIPANVITGVATSNGGIRLWMGDNAGNVFKAENRNSYQPFADSFIMGSSAAYDTCHIDAFETFNIPYWGGEKYGSTDKAWAFFSTIDSLSGRDQPMVYVQDFTDLSTVPNNQQLLISTTVKNSNIGLSFAIPRSFSALKLRFFSISELFGGVRYTGLTLDGNPTWERK